MNENFISEKALDPAVKASCPHCEGLFDTTETKIKFYQGQCPSCGENPFVVTPRRKPKKSHVFSTSFTGGIGYSSLPAEQTLRFTSISRDPR